MAEHEKDKRHGDLCKHIELLGEIKWRPIYYRPKMEIVESWNKAKNNFVVFNDLIFWGIALPADFIKSWLGQAVSYLSLCIPDL